MVSAGKAVVATLIVGGGALGIYALGLNQGWWTLPSWLSGPTAAQKQAAMRRTEQEGRPFPGQGESPGSGRGPTGYVGYEPKGWSGPGGPTGQERMARYAEGNPSSLIPLRENGPAASLGPGGRTEAQNRTVLSRLFQGSAMGR